MRWGRLIAVAAVLATAGLSWWLAERFAAERPSNQNAIGRRSPDYFSKDLRVNLMTPDGAVGRSLATPEMRHYVDEDVSELSSPEITVHSGEPPPWKITAEGGRIFGGGERVLLTGEVRVVRSGTSDSPPVVIVTRNVRYRPADDYVETDEPVTLDSLNDHVEAVGMRAWLRDPARVELLSRAKGRYVPR